MKIIRLLPLIIAVLTGFIDIKACFPCTPTYTFTAGTVISPSQMNTNMTDLDTCIDTLEAKLGGTADITSNLTIDKTAPKLILDGDAADTETIELQEAGTAMGYFRYNGSSNYAEMYNNVISSYVRLNDSGQIEFVSAGSQDITLTPSGNVDISANSLEMGGTAVLTNARVLQNITQATVDNIGLNGNTVSTSSGDLSLTPTTNVDITTGSLEMAGTARLTTGGVATLATGSTIGNLTLANGSITDSGGSISFDNENLTTTGTITGDSVTLSGSTASRALTTDGSKVITASSVTATELGYVSGVTSAIQTQITNNINNTRYHAKGSILQQIYDLMGSTSFSLWAFDQTSGTTITDRGTYAHNLTLGLDASTLSPSFQGLSPTLQFTSGTTNSNFSTADHADYTFGNGVTDSAFSIVSAMVVDDITSSTILAKSDETTGSTQKEYRFSIGSTGLISFVLYDDSAAAQIAQAASSNINSDLNGVHVYGGTYSGSGASSGIILYRDGAVWASASSDSGVYVAMENKSAVLGSYYISTAGAKTAQSGGEHGITIICNTALTALQMKRLYYLLVAYMGTNL